MGMYKIVKMPITSNNPKRKIKSLKAFVFHYTANYSKGANARANRNYFQNHPQVEASANYNIDDSEVVECIEAGWVAWHAGGPRYTDYCKEHFMLNGVPSPNDYTVGFEMCVNVDNDWDQTVENTIDFAAKLAIKMSKPDVALIRHFDTTGKLCPIMYVDNAKWAVFTKAIRDRIKELQNEGKQPDKVSTPTLSGDSYRVVYGDTLYAIATKAKVSVDALKLMNGLTGNLITPGQLLKLKEAPKPVVKAAVASGYAIVNLPKGDVLNVRKGPSTNYAIIGQLTDGQSVRLGNKHGDWWNIYYGSNGGFVHSAYLEVGATAQPAPKPAPAPAKPAPKPAVKAKAKEKWGTVNTDVLNVREKGNTSAKIIGTLKKGQKVQLGVKIGDWWNIYYGNHGGFVHGAYLNV